uniref:Uncharacterized protein n=1 Tax=Timema poppense TaxID=170557 RepID=A0A7R9DJ22_TIMPO|nr:unnamed protein product [Timema poppensis]
MERDMIMRASPHSCPVGRRPVKCCLLDEWTQSFDMLENNYADAATVDGNTYVDYLIIAVRKFIINDLSNKLRLADTSIIKTTLTLYLTDRHVQYFAAMTRSDDVVVSEKTSGGYQVSTNFNFAVMPLQYSFKAVTDEDSYSGNILIEQYKLVLNVKIEISVTNDDEYVPEVKNVTVSDPGTNDVSITSNSSGISDDLKSSIQSAISQEYNRVTVFILADGVKKSLNKIIGQVDFGKYVQQ